MDMAAHTALGPLSWSYISLYQAANYMDIKQLSELGITRVRLRGSVRHNACHGVPLWGALTAGGARPHSQIAVEVKGMTVDEMKKQVRDSIQVSEGS